MVKLRPQIFTVLFLLAFVLHGLQASAYTVQFADKGKTQRLHWKTGEIEVHLSKSLKKTSPFIKSEKGPEAISDALGKAFLHWEEVAGVRFDLAWTDDTDVSVSGPQGDGVSLITIADTPDNIVFFDGQADTAAKTRIFYTGKGQITEGDIVLNPFQLFSDDGTAATFDLESVLTHEIGHLLGLGHSDITGSTMHGHHAQNGIYSLPVTAFRSLAEDDITGVRALYGANEKTANCCGAISGKLLLGKDKTAKDLQVWLEDAESGRIAAGTVADLNGNWSIGGLTAGKYIVYAQGMAAEADAKIKRLYSAERLGEVAVIDGKTAQFEKTFALKLRKISLDSFGFNAQLSTLAVPVNAGKNYSFFIADKTLQSGNFELSFNSPHIAITKGSFRRTELNSGLSAQSFEIRLDEETPAGEYSLRAQNKAGEVFYLLGAVTVDPSVSNTSYSAFIPETVQ
jgi:hypothetical protein